MGYGDSYGVGRLLYSPELIPSEFVVFSLALLHPDPSWRDIIEAVRDIK